MGLDVWAYTTANEPMDNHKFLDVLPVVVGGEMTQADGNYPYGIFNGAAFRGREYARVIEDYLSDYNNEGFSLYEDMDNEKVGRFCAALSQFVDHVYNEVTWKHEIVSYAELRALYEWVRVVAINGGKIHANF